MESMEYIAFQSYAYVNFPVQKYFCSTTNFLTYVRTYLNTVVCRTLDYLARMKCKEHRFHSFSNFAESLVALYAILFYGPFKFLLVFLLKK